MNIYNVFVYIVILTLTSAENITDFNDSVAYNNSDLNWRIFDGQYVHDIRNYPFMAYVTITTRRQGRRGCSFFAATILSPSHLLTVAHAFKRCKCENVDDESCPSCENVDPRDLRVYTGSTSARNNPTISTVYGYIFHPKFKQFDMDNKCIFNFDIAVILLNDPLQLSQKISAVKLPPPVPLDAPDSMTTRYANQRKKCKILGWGKTHIDDDRRDCLENRLKVAEVPLIDLQTCIHYRKFLYPFVTFPNKGVCTSTHVCSLDPQNKAGACLGDSGGPLLCDGVQLGIISYGNPEHCVGPYIVQGYTRVDIHVEELKSILSNF